VGKVSKTLVAGFAIFLTAAGLAACGGGGDSTSSTAESTSAAKSESTPSEAAKQGRAGGASGERKSGSAGESRPGGSGAANFTPQQHSDSGGGSAQFRTKGGDNSVQEFGEEADTSEFDEAAAALHDFLDAGAEGNWAAACRYMSKSVIESFEELAAQTKQVEATDCGRTFEKLTNPAAKALMKAEAEKADVGSLRIEGERAFVIYTGIDGAVLVMPMADEGGAWKVAGLAGTPLS
jgi:hypothetical protein